MLGEPFTAEQEGSMAIMADESLCAILVITQQESDCGKVRVTDIANLKKQRQKGCHGYGEVDIDPRVFWGSLVMIVKCGQNAVVEGSLRLRLFVRVQRGTAEGVAMAVCEDAWTLRHSVSLRENSVWYEHFT